MGMKRRGSGELRIESGEWRVESGEWSAGICGVWVNLAFILYKHNGIPEISGILQFLL